MSNIKFTDTLECTASHGRLALATQIYDEQQKKTQAAINVEALKPSGTDFTNIKNVSATTQDEFFQAVKNLPVGSVVSFDNDKGSAIQINLSFIESNYTYGAHSIFVISATPAMNDDYIDGVVPITPALETIYTMDVEGSLAYTLNAYLSSAIDMATKNEERIAALEARLKV